jgi:hypothetical protein
MNLRNQMEKKGINAFMAGSVISNLRRNMVEWREINPHLTCEEINPPHPHSIQASWELTEPDLNKLSIGFPAWPYGALAPGLVCSCGRCFRSFLSYIDTSFISKYLLFLIYFYIKNDKYLRMKGGPVFPSGGRRIPEIIDQRE